MNHLGHLVIKVGKGPVDGWMSVIKIFYTNLTLIYVLKKFKAI